MLRASKRLRFASLNIEHASVFGLVHRRSLKSTAVAKRAARRFRVVSITCVLAWIVETVAQTRLVAFMRQER